MSKDPAFLFYSTDFYEGTRLMKPEQRACYIDLMIYQHQHGVIPDDAEGLTMYCSGIDKATLKATLKAKFKQDNEGWYNERLRLVIANRIEYTEKQSDNGVLGQFLKKAKQQLSLTELKKLKTFIYVVYGKENVINDLKGSKATHEGVLKALLKHLEDRNRNEDRDTITTKGEIKKRCLVFEAEANNQNNLMGKTNLATEQINDFVGYWTEHGENDTKARFEKQTSFNINRRLNTWAKNGKEWDNSKSGLKKFPDEWSKRFENTLKTTAELQAFWEHLRSKGLKAVKNVYGKTTHWGPIEEKQTA